MKSWGDILTSQPLFQYSFNLRRARVANFADMIKIATIFTKTAFKDTKKSNESEIIIKMQSISVFLDITKLLASD